MNNLDITRLNFILLSYSNDIRVTQRKRDDFELIIVLFKRGILISISWTKFILRGEECYIPKFLNMIKIC